MQAVLLCICLNSQASVHMTHRVILIVLSGPFLFTAVTNIHPLLYVSYLETIVYLNGSITVFTVVAGNCSPTCYSICIVSPTHKGFRCWWEGGEPTLLSR